MSPVCTCAECMPGASVLAEAERETADLRAQLAAAQADLRELRISALPTNCTRCNGVGAEPPGCPESGPCERCGGWTAHKRLIVAEVERLKAALREACELLAEVTEDTPNRAHAVLGRELRKLAGEP